MNGLHGRPRLIVLGASARAAAWSAARAGFEPHAIDLFADRDLKALCPAVRIERYPHDFWRAMKKAPEVPWIYTGGLENYPRLVARLSELRPLWGNSADTLRAIRDPWRLRQVLWEEGIPCPDLIFSSGPQSRKWLLKPRRGSGGLGVRLATAGDLAWPAKGAVFQEYVEGESCSATYVAARGEAVLLGATRQLIGRDWGLAPKFLYLGSLGPLPLSAIETAKLVHLGNVLTRRFNVVGLFGIDFIRTHDELWPIEVNPRYTASVEVLERVTGSSFMNFHAAACVRGQVPPSSPDPAGICAGKAVIYARRDCSWGRESLAANSAPLAANLIPPKTPDPLATAWPTIADIPHDGQQFQAGQPIATVLATGDTLSGVAQLLRKRQAALLDALEVGQTWTVTR